MAYLIRSYTASNADESPLWLALDIRLHGHNFTISVQDSHFHASPNRLREFHAYFAYLTSDMDDAEEELSMEGGFDWAVRPFLAAFTRLAPEKQPVATISLDEYFNAPWYKCQLGAVDDVFDLGPIETVQPELVSIRRNRCPISAPEYGIATSALFPTLSLSEIEVLSTAPGSSIYDDPPRLVRVYGQNYYFKSVVEEGDTLARREIHKYERIVHGKFDLPVRTSRVFAIAQDVGHRITGILFHHIEAATSLDSAVTPETPRDVRDKWIGQIQQTLRALHGQDVVWGDVGDSHVLIDGRGDAWLVGFGGGYTSGWVDAENAETIEGDLQGLAKLIEYISTGEHT